MKVLLEFSITINDTVQNIKIDSKSNEETSKVLESFLLSLKPATPLVTEQQFIDAAKAAVSEFGSTFIEKVSNFESAKENKLIKESSERNLQKVREIVRDLVALNSNAVFGK